MSDKILKDLPGAWKTHKMKQDHLNGSTDVESVKVILESCLSSRKRRSSDTGLQAIFTKSFREDHSVIAPVGDSSMKKEGAPDYDALNLRKMLPVSELEEEKHHLPLNVKHFQDRLSSFDILRWNRVPSMICGFHCARYGWKLHRGKETDYLGCVGCKSCIPIPGTGTGLSNLGPEWANELRNAIESKQHLQPCPWRTLPSPVTILTLPQAFEMYHFIRKSYNGLVGNVDLDIYLEPWYQSIMLQIDYSWLTGIVGLKSEAFDETGKMRLFLVMNGWSSEGDLKNILSCHLCLRKVPLWLIRRELNVSLENKMPKDPKCSTDKSLGFQVPNKILLDPVDNHWWWCPWRRFLEFAPAAEMMNSDRLSDVESIFELRFKDSSLLKPKSSIEDYDRMMKHVQNECHQAEKFNSSMIQVQPRLLQTVGDVMDDFISISWLFNKSNTVTDESTFPDSVDLSASRELIAAEENSASDVSDFYEIANEVISDLLDRVSQSLAKDEQGHEPGGSEEALSPLGLRHGRSHDQSESAIVSSVVLEPVDNVPQDIDSMKDSHESTCAEAESPSSDSDVESDQRMLEDVKMVVRELVDQVCQTVDTVEQICVANAEGQESHENAKRHQNCSKEGRETDSGETANLERVAEHSEREQVPVATPAHVECPRQNQLDSLEILVERGDVPLMISSNEEISEPTGCLNMSNSNSVAAQDIELLPLYDKVNTQCNEIKATIDSMECV